ncbi:hypothetical protein BKA64DRAFT_198521 [Cadophora sp. MPI-SDFR-AT-0126]|nr:hypothetical protein BKA64DRAFT_198521 [Leotiomycetes sp. MPI-SDFR-AT-0126]
MAWNACLGLGSLGVLIRGRVSCYQMRCCETVNSTFKRDEGKGKRNDSRLIPSTSLKMQPVQTVPGYKLTIWDMKLNFDPSDGSGDMLFKSEIPSGSKSGDVTENSLIHVPPLFAVSIPGCNQSWFAECIKEDNVTAGDGQDGRSVVESGRCENVVIFGYCTFRTVPRISPSRDW